MRTIVNYKNNDNVFWRTAIFLSVLMSCIPIGMFVPEFLIIRDSFRDNRLDGLIFLIGPMLIQFLIFKYLQPFFLLADGCRFDINFHSDRFEYIGRFKKKTIYYTEVESLNILKLFFAGMGYSGEMEIIRIKPKNKKRIQLSCKGLSEEKAEELKHDITQYIGMNMSSEKKKFSLFNKTL